MMLSTTKDIWFFVGTFCTVVITFFLSWALYEIARLIRQANEVMTDTREKVDRLEAALTNIGEKFTNVSMYLGLIAEGAKQLFGSWKKRNRRQELEEELAELNIEKENKRQ